MEDEELLCMAFHKRSNFLFAGTDSGGELAANLHSSIDALHVNLDKTADLTKETSFV